MEDSEIKERIINLGKMLVQELSLEPGVDTLSRWMAHYIAEQITIAENATGKNKTKAEQKCYETILELWQRRSTLPDGRRPFEDFEPIFRALERLDPESPRPYYFSMPRINTSKKKGESKQTGKKVQEWIDIALGVDSAARVLIDVAIKQAAAEAKDKKINAWIKDTLNSVEGDEISLVTILVSDYMNGQGEKALGGLRKYYQSRIEKLDAFVETSNSLRAVLVNELEKLPADSLTLDADSRSNRKPKKPRTKKRT